MTEKVERPTAGTNQIGMRTDLLKEGIIPLEEAADADAEEVAAAEVVEVVEAEAEEAEVEAEEEPAETNQASDLYLITSGV